MGGRLPLDWKELLLLLCCLSDGGARAEDEGRSRSLPTDDEREWSELTLLLRETRRDACGVRGSRDTACRGVLIEIEAQLWRRPKFAKFSKRIFSRVASESPPTTSPSRPQQRCTQLKRRAIWESAQNAVELVGSWAGPELELKSRRVDDSDGVADVSFLHSVLVGVVELEATMVGGAE